MKNYVFIKALALGLLVMNSDIFSAYPLWAVHSRYRGTGWEDHQRTLRIKLQESVDKGDWKSAKKVIDEKGENSLMYQVAKQDTLTLRTLIVLGAKVDDKNFAGFSARDLTKFSPFTGMAQVIEAAERERDEVNFGDNQ